MIQCVIKYVVNWVVRCICMYIYIYRLVDSHAGDTKYYFAIIELTFLKRWSKLKYRFTPVIMLLVFIHLSIFITSLSFNRNI